MTQLGNTPVFFLGEQSWEEYVAQKRREGIKVGIVKYQRTTPKTFVDSKTGEQVTLDTIRFVKQVFHNPDGTTSYGNTFANVSSRFDSSKPAKLVTRAYYATVKVFDYDLGQFKEEYKLVTDICLCNAGQSTKGELEIEY